MSASFFKLICATLFVRLLVRYCEQGSSLLYTPALRPYVGRLCQLRERELVCAVHVRVV